MAKIDKHGDAGDQSDRFDRAAPVNHGADDDEHDHHDRDVSLKVLEPPDDFGRQRHVVPRQLLKSHDFNRGVFLDALKSVVRDRLVIFGLGVALGAGYTIHVFTESMNAVDFSQFCRRVGS